MVEATWQARMQTGLPRRLNPGGDTRYEQVDFELVMFDKGEDTKTTEG
jgi:hypothetical protein